MSFSILLEKKKTIVSSFQVPQEKLLKKVAGIVFLAFELRHQCCKSMRQTAFQKAQLFWSSLLPAENHR